MGARKAHYKSFNTRVLEKYLYFHVLKFTFVVSYVVNVLVTDIILKITSQEYLIFTLLHIGSRLIELFSKEVHVKKQPEMSLKLVITSIFTRDYHNLSPTMIWFTKNKRKSSIVEQQLPFGARK